MVSRLPIRLRPAHNELTVSYLSRLATLHGIAFTELWSQVSSRRRHYGVIVTLDGDLLVAVTGQSRKRLSRALIETRERPDWRALRHEPQPGCHRCNARHLGGTVIQLLGHHDYVCTRHRIWIGPPDLPDRPQPALPQLPEVVAAQHAHRRLLRRFGPAATYDAVLTGFLICGRRWDTIADSSREPGPDDAWHHWKRRSNLLIPPGTEAATFSASRLFATVYPEAVHIAALLASRHWRRRAAGGPADQRPFAAEIGRRLGQPDYRPQRLGDPITQWMEQTCWRPPSQPSVHFRMERTFGGPSHRKPDQRGIDSTPGRAQQFAADRNTVSSMIYHRSLAIIRSDISDHQRETRAAKLHAHPPTSTGNATLPGIEGDTLALAGEQFERPQPVSSPFWDTAIEPIPWPPRPRQTVRSRPGPWPTSTTQGQESAN